MEGTQVTYITKKHPQLIYGIPHISSDVAGLKDIFVQRIPRVSNNNSRKIEVHVDRKFLSSFYRCGGDLDSDSPERGNLNVLGTLDYSMQLFDYPDILPVGDGKGQPDGVTIA